MFKLSPTASASLQPSLQDSPLSSASVDGTAEAMAESTASVSASDHWVLLSTKLWNWRVLGIGCGKLGIVYTCAVEMHLKLEHYLGSMDL